ncbi:MAG: porin family protein [Bacteroidales bacterium]|jgi:hypothetical protein|nr:porin family protein [Bacteroidales bacterium]MDD4672706.1 porin family protein [Bacteroidales bacterium]MDY0347572.1 porin family protein [Tenuifilaceae bacterium]
MRKLILPLTIFLICYTGTLHAQDFKGGLLAGMSATQVDGDGYGGYKQAGLTAGVWVSLPISNTYSIRTELKFLQKGSHSQTKDELGAVTDFYKLRLNYIALPFLLEYHFNEKFVPFVGIDFGYLWKAYESNMEGSFPEEDIAKFRKVEISASGGVEYLINSRFSFCASFSYSAFPVRRHRGDITYRLNRGQFNNVLQFYLRYHM